ncbi:LysR family transcriptional regulator [Lysinibacter cavernae]|uniref:DNA-binding transcriptional LysR family regulator n=1 Tax=Lysinibacter cavernae TaxID=1640652 RepID=A0A7X5R2M3_9MICO|nr:LysR family transcriptional regulator [Lysinibacter cavernae]NIH54543.1 DNA-binding transcriptional LysR family regulator [Lysinibacter cavernae]
MFVEIRWIESFVAVAEELHFGRAAERLRVSQSPLSQTIRKLEADLGAELFRRNTRTVSLTPAGHSFLVHARKVLSEVDLARRSTTETNDGIYGNVSIGFSGVLNHLTLPRLTRQVRQRYPGINLTLVDRVISFEAMQLVKDGDLDLAFIGLPADSPPLQTRAISLEPMGATLPSDHPLADRDKISLSELAEEDFVSLPIRQGSAVRERMFQSCLNVGFRPRVVQEVIDPYLVLSFVAAGVGVSVMPSCISGIMPAGSVYVPVVEEDCVLLAGIIWDPNNGSLAVRKVLEIADEILPVPAGL